MTSLKRKRDDSPPARPLKLTKENLRRLDQLTSPDMSTISPSRSGRRSSQASSPTRDSHDPKNRLEAYNFHINEGHKLPAELGTLVQEICRGNNETNGSPQKVVRKLREAQMKNEATAIDDLTPHLLESKLDKRMTLVRNLNLSRSYAPPAPDILASNMGALTAAQADQAIGYKTPIGAQVSDETQLPPISRELAKFLPQPPLCEQMLVPFLTSEWKSYIAQEGQYVATQQGARDGAVMNNYLHKLYETAGMEPTIRRTAHFSFTTEVKTIDLHIHWRQETEGKVHYYMQPIKEGILSRLDDNRNFADYMRNLFKYAMGKRLEDIIAALRQNKTRLESETQPLQASASSSTTAEPPQDLGITPYLPPPSPPASRGHERPLKRAKKKRAAESSP